MLRKGALVLSIWCWLNVVPAGASLLLIIAGKHAPGLTMQFTAGEIPGIESRALAMVDGLATLLNALIIVYCITCFILVRQALLKRERGSFVVFALGAFVVQVVCYLADRSFFLSKNTAVLHVSSLFLVTGFGLCAREIFKKEPNSEGSVSP